MDGFAVKWDQVTAICAVMGVIGAFGLFLMKAIIREAFSEQWKLIEERFASHDQLKNLEQRVTILEKHPADCGAFTRLRVAPRD